MYIVRYDDGGEIGYDEFETMEEALKFAEETELLVPCVVIKHQGKVVWKSALMQFFRL